MKYVCIIPNKNNVWPYKTVSVKTLIYNELLNVKTNNKMKKKKQGKVFRVLHVQTDWYLTVNFTLKEWNNNNELSSLLKPEKDT